MVLIPAGEFEMGSISGESDEKPAHTVYLDAFYIDKYEVTNEQYRKFVRATGYKEPTGYKLMNEQWKSGFKPWSEHNFGGDKNPVVCVTWEDANAYCKWAGKRLPTEAEWEKSARGKLEGKIYVWGDNFPPLKNAGNFDDENAVDKDVITGYNDGYAFTAPVGRFTPNGYGLFDMAGNVWEWVADWYSKDYYLNSPKSNPMGPNSGEYHILRGGAWDYSLGRLLRVSVRASSPSVSTWNLGFRCAMDAKP